VALIACVMEWIDAAGLAPAMVGETPMRSWAPPFVPAQAGIQKKR
jgi:hypothetical protein